MKSKLIKIWLPVSLIVVLVLIFHLTARKEIGVQRPPANNKTASVARSIRSAQALLIQLPPVGMPLMASQHDLLRASAEGNKAASRRLFEDTRVCMQGARLSKYKDKINARQTWILAHENAFAAKGTAGKDEMERELSTLQANLDRIAASSDLCDGYEEKVDDGRYYQFALQAASAGDDAAVACLVFAPYNSPDLNQAETAAYQRQVNNLATEAVKRGSWRTVYALALAAESLPISHGFASYTYRADPTAAMKYTELMRLGALDGSPDAIRLDRQIAAMAKNLSGQQQEVVQEWANETYHKYFFFSDISLPVDVPCDF